jgi:FAD dependent oxidoreductase
MKRREFLDISLRAGGIALAAPGLLNLQACSEINKQFTGGIDFPEYDLVINGAGLYGYFAAINAAEMGKKVLLVEKRTFPGYEITAKRKLWLGTRGIDDFRPDLMALVLPPGEKEEIQNVKGEEPESSRFGDEVLLFAGSVKKTLLRKLLVKKVHVLLMTDVCGVFSDNENVKGVLLAGKHGLHTVRCKNFIDASDNVIFSRKLLGDKFVIKRAGFVMELENVLNPQQKHLKVSDDFGLHENCIKFHQGKRNENQLFIEFDFPVNTQIFSEIEQKSRLIAADIGEKFTTIIDSLRDAKIMQFAFECSISLENNTLPDPVLKGYYLLSGANTKLDFEKISEIEAEAKSLTNSIKYSKKNSDPGVLLLPGIKIPYKDISISDLKEPGLAIPLKNCSFDYKKWIIDKKNCQVLVAGGGTAGALSGMGAGEKGASTIVVDYFNDLGGTKTMGGVIGYYHGVVENVFLKTQDLYSKKVASYTNSTNNIGRRLFHLKRILNTGGKYISGAIMCGSVVNNKKVEGVLICRNGELGIVSGDITIDATGDGDIAFFAGEKYKMGDSRTGKTQNYSQWDIPVKGKLPSPAGRDYDIIDNTKISELQRGLFLSHYEAHHYDFNPMLTVRESRQIEGLYTMDLTDAVEGTHFEDIISLARSDFDPHYVANSEFSRCGFLLPHSNLLTVEIPYRSIVPKNLDGLLISGRAISVTHNSMQFTRMSGDILVLGYLTGQIAADIASQRTEPRSYSVSEIQKDWVAKGFIPAEYLAKTPGNQIKDKTEIIRRVNHLSNGERDYLYECIRIPKELILPLLYEEFDKSRNSSGDLLIAKALAWFGEKEGNDLIENELNQLFQIELKEGYSDGYIENYDLIRGREKNQLEGLFWRINQNIALLAMTGNPQSIDSIKNILENTSSGGPVFKREGARSAYFNERIDLRLIPYYNRILNLCFYADRLPDHSLIPSLEKLLADDNIKGFVTEEYYLTRWRVYRSDLELFMASSLARCGSESGYELLIRYLSDIHYRFKLFSVTELKELTDEDFGFNPEAWTRHIRSLEFPRSCKNLIKSIEV